MSDNISASITFLCIPELITEAFEKHASGNMQVRGCYETLNALQATGFQISDPPVVNICFLHLNTADDLLTLKEVKASSLKAVGVISTDDFDPVLIRQAIYLKCNGLVRITLKDSAKKLIKHVSRLMEGEDYYEADLMQYFVASNNPHEAFNNLSSKEQDVGALAVVGYANSEIASFLTIELATVKKHIQNIFKKLGIKDRQALRHYITPQDAEIRTVKITKGLP